MKTNAIKLLFTTILLTGCVSTQNYTDHPYAPVSPNHVEVVDLHQIQHPYAIIGEVDGMGVGTNTLRKKAADLGADAISIPGIDVNGISHAQAIKYKN